MIFDGKPTSQIQISELESLVADHVGEDEYLDFKALPHSGSNATHELIKDVCAFANAAGGYLVIGVAEDGEGRASGFVPVQNAEAVRRSMIDRCFARIEPRLPTLDVRIFLINGNSIVVCRVPDSPLKPHFAQPDREHHYFWKRYVDGNKLMTYSEIRDAIQGDAVQREIVSLRTELQRTRHQATVASELEREVDQQQLLQLASQEALAHHSERIFLQTVGDRPYFRLTATPPNPGSRNLRPQRETLMELLADPPAYRRNGFDVGIHAVGEHLRQTPMGLQTEMIEYKHLRLLWNGHLEFWTPANDELISLGLDQRLPVEDRSLEPLVLIEATASFVRLARAVWEIAGVAGESEFRLFLHRVRNRRIPPYADNTYGRLSSTPALLANPTIGAFQQDDVRVGPVLEGIENLPGAVAFRLIADVYYCLGYSREHIPYFTDDDRFIYDVPPDQRAD